jgi:hypothetical protein
MKKALLTVLVGLCCSATVNAQVKATDDVKKMLETTNKDTIAWVYGGVIDIGLNEGFLHNWPAGGELASLSALGIFSAHLDRLYHRDIWTNNLDIAYGLNYTYSTGFLPKKVDDRIDFTSKYGKLIDDSKNFYLAALFNFRTQFTKGYDYTIPGWDTIPKANTSKAMSPAYFTLALGGEYRKGSDVSLFFSPLAARFTLVNKIYTTGPTGAFGVPQNESDYFQLGAYFSGRYTKEFSKKGEFKTRLDLYSNYLAKDTKDSTGKVIKKDNPGNIAVLWGNLFSWKISKFFNVIVGATFIYDNNIPYSKTYINNAGVAVLKDDPGRNYGWVQINQLFTFGIEYKF